MPTPPVPRPALRVSPANPAALLLAALAAAGCAAGPAVLGEPLGTLGPIYAEPILGGEDGSVELGVAFELADSSTVDAETCEAVSATAGMDDEILDEGTSWGGGGVSLDNWLVPHFTDNQCRLPTVRVPLAETGGEAHDVWLMGGGDIYVFRLFVPPDLPELDPEGDLEFHGTDPLRFLLPGVDIRAIDEADWMNEDTFPRDVVDLKTDLVEDGLDVWIPGRTDDTACDESCKGVLTIRLEYELRRLSCDGFASCGGQTQEVSFTEGSVRWYP